LFGDVVIEPDSLRVIVPPVAILRPVPLLRIPEIKFRLVTATVALTSRVELALFNVSVPSSLPVIPAEPPGRVPEPFIIIADADVTPIVPLFLV
jgi:hypothetical protein